MAMERILIFLVVFAVVFFVRLRREKKSLREMMLVGQKGDEVLMKVFLAIAGGLVIVGFVRDDFLWFIRAGIFCLAALFLWWRRGA